MTVISDGGLVGVVKSVNANSSIVLLMSDPTFKIGVRIAGTQGIGVVSGQGGNKYLLQLLDATGEIKVGAGFGIKESRGSCLGEETTTATTPIRSKLLEEVKVAGHLYRAYQLER